MTNADTPIEELDWSTLGVQRRGEDTPEAPDMLVVTIDRPGSDLNSVDEALHSELARLFRCLRRERTARAILLTGSGRAFCAGGDFEWFEQLRSVEALESLRIDARQIIWDMLDIEVPIVCALNGHAMGLGASITLLCDLVVASDSVRIGDPHVSIGLVAGDGGTVIWPAALGPAKAKEHLLLGEPVGAVEAERLGMVNRVVPGEDVFDTALELASGGGGGGRG
ncbi:MAG: enoyl-CoA hydratase/isomerase family protein, partial [Microthrixaceae bacterium]